MRINPVSSFSYHTNFGIKNIENTNNIGVNGDKLIMTGKAKEYFTVIKNLSNEKVGSKFLIKSKLPEYKDLTLLITPDSKIESNDMFIGIKQNNNAAPSFKGRLYGSIRDDGHKTDSKMQEEYIRFWTEGMHDLVSSKYIDRKYAPRLKQDYNFFIPSDGDGTRYKDITTLQGGVTKPASYIPATLNGKSMSLVQNVISNFTRTGKLDRTFSFIKVTPAQGSAYAFLQGLKSGQIPTDKPIVFSWGDNFTDADISRLMFIHEQSGADFTVTTIPVDKSDVKSLSVVKVDSVKNKNITDFIEKPKDDELINSFVVTEFGKDKCLSAVGPYIISPKVLKWVKNKYIENPEYFKNPDKGYDFSSMIVSKSLESMKSGEIKNGKMKLALISKKETWSDLGSQKDFSSAMKNVVLGAYSKLPAEIILSLQKNIDDNGNITFNTRSRNMLKSLASRLNLKLDNVIAYCNQ